jgi:hypothetical protein
MNNLKFITIRQYWERNEDKLTSNKEYPKSKLTGTRKQQSLPPHFEHIEEQLVSLDRPCKLPEIRN